MARPSRYPQDLRERAIRMVAEVRPNHRSENEAIRAVATSLEITTPETLRTWIRQAQIDSGERRGVSTDEAAELQRLRQENAHLRRSNEILRAVASFIAAELDRP
jgi:transposase